MLRVFVEGCACVCVLGVCKYVCVYVDVHLSVNVIGIYYMCVGIDHRHVYVFIIFRPCVSMCVCAS